MKRAKIEIEQPIMWILIILAGFLVAYGIYRLMKLATERGLPGIFG